MLRLLLDAIQSIKLVPSRLALEPGARWYSEARLSSPFAPRRRADGLAEGLTNADGVLGQFEFRRATRTGLSLKPGANQLVVLEAKMYSNLSPGTKNAPAYNQAVRNLACMAWALAQAGRKPTEFESLGFYVIAPAPARRRPGYSNLENFIDPSSIKSAMHQRIATYEAMQREEALELRRWEQEHFVPLVDRLIDSGSLAVLSWEDCIREVQTADASAGEELGHFYFTCLATAQNEARDASILT
ncbi:hypothetical protein [Mesorhizobium sp.]|uniref:hypothetical protein n=1 Tax=Mesorhizobium sp. TaxID=1871066 RepID=UPI000FE7CFDD|nr:hypothetical protein [Mesorhizobium sp.]RWQ57829.1 MAG: hypothetical protein EOS84_04640 [Mesorhizobium sp.]